MALRTTVGLLENKKGRIGHATSPFFLICSEFAHATASSIESKLAKLARCESRISAIYLFCRHFFFNAETDKTLVDLYLNYSLTEIV
jgi:hypothetical protein